VFVFFVIVRLIVGFKLNVLGAATRTSRAVYWAAAVFTAVTIVYWGWWRL
jgi:hypothetical protein